MTTETRREVTGVDTPFLEAVDAGDITRPPLLSWNDWQQWRRDQGSRPSQGVDGYVPTSKDEASLWRKSMQHLYGEDWAADSIDVDHAELLLLARRPEVSSP